MAKPRRAARTDRRRAARVHAELVQDLERLAALRPGGSAEHPRDVESPAQVDVIATASLCPLCEGPLQLESHDAPAAGRRAATVRCTSCGTRRTVHFRLTRATLQ